MGTRQRAARMVSGLMTAGWLLGLALPMQAEIPTAAPNPKMEQMGKRPRGVTMLFDGKDTGAWIHRGSDKPCEWQIIDGALEVAPDKGDLLTREKFTDYQLHVEFMIPLMPDKHSQERGNSGCYQHGLYEVQILDAYQNETYAKGGCAAIYELKDPDKNACRPPLQWQSYNITFRAPRFDADGKVTANPRITVLWNGVKVHENVEITNGPTRASLEGPMTPTGPIMLQAHGTKVRYRNIWIKPLTAKEAEKRLPIPAKKEGEAK